MYIKFNRNRLRLVKDITKKHWFHFSAHSAYIHRVSEKKHPLILLAIC